MDDAIEDGVSEGGLANHLMPRLHGELTGNQRRAGPVAVLDDLHQVAPLAGGEPLRAPVVEDQQIGLGEYAEEAREAAIAVRQLEVGEEPWHARVVDCVSVAAGLLRERAR